MVAGTGFSIDNESGTHSPASVIDRFFDQWFYPALPVQHTLPFGNNHLKPGFPGGQSLAQCSFHFIYAVRANSSNPFYPSATTGFIDRLLIQPAGFVSIHCRGYQTIGLHQRRDILTTGGCSISIIYDYQYAIVFIKNSTGNATGQSIVPKATVTHDADSLVGQRSADAG
jgi:hypothetical protein